LTLSLSGICLLTIPALADPVFEWADTYDGGGAHLDEISVALVDPAGNLVIGGESFDGVNGSDMLYRKLDRDDHHEIWSTRVEAFDTSDMAVSGMVWDSDGDILAAGYIRGCEG
jgi:hypothetical protein